MLCRSKMQQFNLAHVPNYCRCLKSPLVRSHLSHREASFEHFISAFPSSSSSLLAMVAVASIFQFRQRSDRSFVCLKSYMYVAVSPTKRIKQTNSTNSNERHKKQNKSSYRKCDWTYLMRLFKTLSPTHAHTHICSLSLSLSVVSTKSRAISFST